MEGAAKLLRWLLLLLFGLLCVDAQKVSKKEFSSAVDFPYYFEDSDTVLISELNAVTRQGSGKLWRSTDGGANWEETKTKKEDDEIRGVQIVITHPFDNTIAFALTPGEELFYTHDQGETWETLWLPEGLTPTKFAGREIFSFNPADPKKIVFNTQNCLFRGRLCEEEAWFSDDGLMTINRLADFTRQCIFARSKAEFKEIADEGGANRILCVVKGKMSPFESDNRLYVSDDLFETYEEPALSEGRTVSGILSIASVKGYLVAAARADRSTEMALFASIDGKIWHQAVFDMANKLEEGYTILESTNYSIQLVVQNSLESGTLLSSNSNGTYFEESLEGINKDLFTGIVDFEKVQGFQGVLMANVIDNLEKVEDKGKDPKVKSKISFHDGKSGTWKPLKTDKDDEIHLHSVTDARNSGRIFSSAAPGVMLGVGNSGSHLKGYDKGDLYVSNDAGRTWEKALNGPWKYEFADEGNVLFAISDSRDRVKDGKYSVDHGKTWKDLEIDDEDFKPQLVTTVEDNTSLRVLLIGRRKGDDDEAASIVVSVDFDEVLERDCGKGDMEEFSALSEDDPCVMGHRQVYRRRKREADCFIRAKFDEPFPENQQCTCSKEDFECDTNFIPKDGKCEAARRFPQPEGQCKDKDDTYEGPSGFRLIPGDDCKRSGGEDLDKEIDRPCSETSGSTPTGDQPESTITEFGEEARVREFEQLVYLERADYQKGDDETVLFLDDRGRVYISQDHGKIWTPLADLHSAIEQHTIVAIIQHEYISDAVFFITDYKTVFYSYDRCEHLHSFEAPHEWTPDAALKGVARPLSFHEDYPNWFLWTGEEFSGGPDSGRFVSQLSRDRGDDWKTIARGTRRCEFIKREGRDRDIDDDGKSSAKNLIFCVRYSGESSTGDLELVKSADFFDSEEIVFNNIVDFATMSEFLVVAQKGSEESLSMNASVYGGPFAPAHFPPQFDPRTTAFTILQSETHAVFVHVTTNSVTDAEYGRIMKSNSNGTFYVTSVDYVNRDRLGYVDFEKVKGLEGVSLVNVVANPKELDAGEDKKLQSRITHNDGAEWAPLEAPATDFDGKRWGCKGQSCKIHLYSFTEKLRHPRSFSSESAIGLLIANGNVGESLDLSDTAKDATFLSSDGGMNWDVVGTGKHFWAYGDQGSIIVLVPQGKTKTLRWSDTEGKSIDGGKAWYEFDFAEEEIEIQELTTITSDNSKNFLIWGKGSKGVVTINIDFSDLRDRECKLDDTNLKSKDNDYWSWSPKHPGLDVDDDCIFGHQALYHRKKPESKCWNGRRIASFHDIDHNCPCRRTDFECDYNYERQLDGTCQLVQGYEPLDHSLVCQEDPDRTEWYEPRGYRRIPLDTCEGGLTLERAQPRPCPGHEEDFNKKHSGLTGFAFFLVAICLPFGAAAGIGYWVYKRWDGKFGAIRLGENGTEGVLDIDKPWIKYPVMALSAVAAVAMAIPGMLASAWRGANALIGRSGAGRYTSRASFARNRGVYTVVEDEDELFGEDEDEV